MSLRRNVTANYLGQGWAAVMALAFVPIYIRYLGIEAFGLIGLFAMMQTWLTLLDMGMTPTLGREMARFTAGAHSPQSIRTLLRSLEVVCFGVAAAICLCVWAAAGWLASDWLRAEKLPASVVTEAITVMAFVIALRFVEGLYRSALFGLQQQVWTNAVNAALATLRGVGAVTVLVFISPSIEAFFVWQALVSLISVIVLALGVHRALPPSPAPTPFSREALAAVWRFAGGMTGIALLAVLLTQVDKVLLSRLLTLEAFGYYALAATVSGALYLIVTPITTALFPRLVELTAQSDPARLGALYHRGAGLVTALVAPPALLLAFFGDGVLFAWSGSAELAHRAGPILAALSLGNFLNCLMYMPYHLQLAHGWTSLTFKINIVAVALLIPAIFWVVPRYGALGAAAVWIALNAAYMLVVIHWMHRRLLPAEKWHWYFKDIGLPVACCAAAFALLELLRPTGLESRTHWIAFLLGAALAAFGAALMALPEFRARLSIEIRQRLTTSA